MPTRLDESVLPKGMLFCVNCTFCKNSYVFLKLQWPKFCII